MGSAEPQQKSLVKEVVTISNYNYKLTQQLCELMGLLERIGLQPQQRQKVIEYVRSLVDLPEGQPNRKDRSHHDKGR